MFALIIFLTCLFAACGVGVMAAVSDYRGLTIPNWHSGAVMAAFFVCYGLLWLLGRDDVFAALSSHLLSGLVVFLVTLVMFAAGGLGAADSKLGSAFALWVGLKGLIVFLFYMAVIGGFLALGALALQKWKPFENPTKGGWIAQVQNGESKVPYGIAIVGGALVSFVKIGYIGAEVLASFVVS